jgi:hypothetical protein
MTTLTAIAAEISSISDSAAIPRAVERIASSRRANPEPGGAAHRRLVNFRSRWVGPARYRAGTTHRDR